MENLATTLRAELVACLHRISSGDQGALEYLYKRTGAKLFGICTRILSDPVAAEDVLQEVFLTVWNKAGQFDPSLGVSPITWLTAIARNDQTTMQLWNYFNANALEVINGVVNFETFVSAMITSWNSNDHLTLVFIGSLY